ncbi:MAG TPA: hypothetical protein VJA21_03140 [Verrucomicrobiae bacterium]
MRKEIIVVLLGTMAFAGCQSSEDKMRQVVSTACSNEVVGITRIVKISIWAQLANVSGCFGNATVERVNSVGGIERVRLSFETGIADGKAWVDMLPGMEAKMMAIQFGTSTAYSPTSNGPTN